MGHMSASYGQFCPIAKASEIFATRWTPLIVREIMTGVHSFNDIHRGLPLISRAVLVARLRELEDHGVIERRPRGAERLALVQTYQRRAGITDMTGMEK